MPSTPVVSRMFSAPDVTGLDMATQALLNQLVAQWLAHVPRNIERMVYLDAKNKLNDLGVALPPQLVDKLDVVVGWPEKAVYEVANRIVLEGLTMPDGSPDPFGLKRLLRDNRFDVEFPQSVASSLAQSCSFVTTTPGDMAAGEPPVLLMFHSALWATGLWDRRRRGLKAGLLISETDKMGHPTVLTILLPTEHVVCSKTSAGWYVSAVIPHALGRTPMEPLPFRPTTERPFGRSRIDRTVMSLTDRAVRAGARLEVHSELFTSMKLLLMGADEESFKDKDGNMVPLWSFFLGRLNMLSKDEDGDTPTLEKIAAESPEPHIAIARQLASAFSGHTGVPMSSLGISSQTPESAQAQDGTRESIINDVEKQHVIFGFALSRAFEDAVMIRDRLSEPPADMIDLGFKWRRADRPTLAAIADAGAKQVASIPWLADTEVGMELAGLSPEQIQRAMADKRRMRGSGVLETLQAAAGRVVEDPAAVKAKADAMGVLIRAGVDPKDAATRVGFDGLDFTGAVPTSLRLPAVDASGLEGGSGNAAGA